MSSTTKIQKGQGMPDQVEITLHESDNIPPIGLFIGHNGRTFILKPGQKVKVPKAVQTILDDAIVSEAIIDPETRQVAGYRSMPRYPYTLHRVISAEPA